jgi:hypothetical protein
MRFRITVLALAVALTGAIAFTPKGASAQTPPATGITLPCSPLGVSLPLLCNITSFANTGGVLTASGTITNAAGNVNLPFTNVPVQNLSAGPGNSCRILHLTLGPIDLNLLGLEVQTNQIVLDITAHAGNGNLLGNLLCAVAGLFDNQAPTDLLAGLLNYIIGA